MNKIVKIFGKKYEISSSLSNEYEYIVGVERFPFKVHFHKKYPDYKVWRATMSLFGLFNYQWEEIDEDLNVVISKIEKQAEELMNDMKYWL